MNDVYWDCCKRFSFCNIRKLIFCVCDVCSGIGYQPGVKQVSDLMQKNVN